MQSAYKKHHRTETAGLRGFNDDERKECILILLDMSAAFDTIDQQIVLTQLHDRYGINGTAL